MVGIERQSRMFLLCSVSRRVLPTAESPSRITLAQWTRDSGSLPRMAAVPAGALQLRCEGLTPCEVLV